MTATPLEHASLHEKQLNLSVLQDALLHIWELPSAVSVALRESLSGHRSVFLKAIYTATDAEDVTAASKMFEKTCGS